MNMIDAIIIGITLILAIKGFFNGVIKEVSGLIGLIGGLFIATKYYHQTGIYIDENLMKINNPSAIDLVGFIVDFVGVWIVVVFLGFLISRILKISALGIFDRIAGFIFSGAKFFVLISVILALLYNVAFLKDKIDNYAKNSFVMPILLKVGDKIINIDPKKIENISKNVKITQ